MLPNVPLGGFLMCPDKISACPQPPVFHNDTQDSMYAAGAVAVPETSAGSVLIPIQTVHVGYSQSLDDATGMHQC